MHSCITCLTSVSLKTKQTRGGPLNTSGGAATFGKFGPHVGNNKFNAQNEE